MKTVLLSFQPHVFDLIRSGKKIFEYRYQYADEETKVFMYVSKPVQKILGCMELGKRINLSDWAEQYKDNDEVSERIAEYMNRNNRYVMPIKRFTMTNEITLAELQNSLEKFIIPQSYYYLEKFPDLLNYVNNNIEYLGEAIENDFLDFDIKHICVKKYD